MTGYPYTQTTSSAATSTGLSTQILIKVDDEAIGAIQSLQVQQSRPIERIKEVGTDGTIELVPTGATEVSLSVSRIVFDKKRLTEAFSRGYLNIHAQRIPFDIFVYDFQGASGELDANFNVPDGATGVITTIFENCWFTSLDVSYDSDNYIITENADIEVEWVHSFADGNSSINASRANPSFDDKLERYADVNRRGSLDARGLTLVDPDNIPTA